MKVNFSGQDYGVQFQEYGNGRLALVLVGRRGETGAVATVNAPDVPLLPHQLLIKDYSENEGMLAALEKAGIVKASGLYVRSGHVSLPVCEVLISPPGKQTDCKQSLAELKAGEKERRPERQKSRNKGMER